MREISTQIEINSSPDKVWDILIDFDKYPEWNPFILSIIGKPKLRERLKVTLMAKPDKHMVFKPKVTMCEKNKRFVWLGQLFMTGLFDGHHFFELKSKGGGSTTFIHREEFSGLLVPMFWKSIEDNTHKSFIEMNLALKKRVEST